LQALVFLKEHPAFFVSHKRRIYILCC